MKQLNECQDIEIFFNQNIECTNLFDLYFGDDYLGLNGALLPPKWQKTTFKGAYCSISKFYSIIKSTI